MPNLLLTCELCNREKPYQHMDLQFHALGDVITSTCFCKDGCQPTWEEVASKAVDRLFTRMFNRRVTESTPTGIIHPNSNGNESEQ